jgi:two-component system LytT family sensor kinase
VLAFPWLRGRINHFVDRAVLSRADYEQVLEDLNGILQGSDAEVVLSGACDRLGSALGAATVQWTRRSTLDGVKPADVVVHTAEAPYFILEVGPLAGGRRLLSDDVRLLQHAALLLARRIDALRLTNERYERMLHEREMRTLATEAELRALRAQINPHFLFNALTTIGYLIQSAPQRGFDTLMLLTTLLRSVLRPEGEFTTLGRERELIESYLRIERERFEERLTVEIDIPPSLEHIALPSLIVQPLVENAIKHGIARSRAGGAVSLAAVIEASQLCITVRNTGARLKTLHSSDGGVGLANVERRLECYYGTAASFALHSAADGATLAELRLPLDVAAGGEDAEFAAMRRA